MPSFSLFDPFLDARAEIKKYFLCNLAQMKTREFAFEIYWPLECPRLWRITIVSKHNEDIWRVNSAAISLDANYFELLLSQQKLGTYLENKVFWSLQNINNEKCAPNMIFFHEKKIRMNRIILDVEIWLWKLEFCKLLRTRSSYKISAQNLFIHCDPPQSWTF